MRSPLIFDTKHPKWMIAIKILQIIGSARARKIASRLKICDIEKFLLLMKLLVMADLFDMDLSSLISEINSKDELKKIIGSKEILEIQYFYRMHSNIDHKVIYTFFRRLIKPKRRSRQKRPKTVIIDTTSIVLDLNTWRNRFRIGKTGKQYKYSYDPSRGYYVGFKLILAISLDFEILGFEIYENSPNDSKILIPFVENLYKSKIISSRCIIICDKGFTSKRNYHILINRFYVVPLIYPRKNTNINRILDSLNPPLDAFFYNKYKLKLWTEIVSKFKELITKWEFFKEIRSKIEDIFNIAKSSIGMDRIHQYTTPSVKKNVSRKIFLSAELIYLSNMLNISPKAISVL